jgi:type IV fimbrial biogenesis protein FimT
MKQVSRGFTLMELGVTLTVAAVILGVAIPNLRSFKINARMTNTANDVLASITRARTEAIKRQVSVSMCASANPLATSPTCTDGATAGFIVFVDAGATPDCLFAVGDTLLDQRAYDNSMANNQLVVNSNGNCISYAPTGFLQNIASRVRATRLLFCDNRNLAAMPGTTDSAARGVLIETTGRVRTTRDRSSGLSSDMTTWNSTWSGLTCP